MAGELRTPRRSPLGAAVLSVPILMGVGMFAAGIGLFVAIQIGGKAIGETVRYTFGSTCELQARPVLLTRIQELGLPVQAFGAGLDLQVQLPGVADDEREHVPRAVTRMGTFEVLVDGKPFPAAIRHAGFQLSLQTGAATTLVNLNQAPPAGALEVRIDGVPVDVESVNGGELMLTTTEQEPQRAIREATERAVAIRHPLPCEVVLTRTEHVAGG